MEGDQHGESRRRAVLYRGLITEPLVLTDTASPFFNYGKGFFETILYDKGKLHFFDEHLERMKKTSSEMLFSLDFNQISKDLVLDLLNHNRLKDHCCRVKIIYAPVKKADRWDTVVYASPYTRPGKDFVLSVHNEVYDSLLNRYKSLNYEYNLHWKNYYQKKEYSDEVLFCNKEGNILEGSYTNILLISDSVLYYVDRRCHYLQGIMQDQVLKAAGKIKGLEIKALEKGISLKLVKEADELLICNSLMMIQKVRKIIAGDDIYRWETGASIIATALNKSVQETAYPRNGQLYYHE